MAEKTANGSGLDDRSAKLMLKQRISQMDDLAGLRSSKECFREGLVEYFEGPKVRSRQSLGIRILNWAFSEEARPRRFRYCCDACAGANQRQETLTQHVLSVFAKQT